MNSNKIKICSMFLLAIILAVGTISVIPTTFAQSQYTYVPQQEYTGYENSYGNGYDKQVSDVNIQKVKCNNIIINGVEKSNPTTGDIPNAMAADENDEIGEQQSQGFGKGEKKFKEISGNIVNVCINKNNGVVILPDEEINTCEDCFREFLNEQQIAVVVDELNVSTVSTLEELCEFISSAAAQGLFLPQLVSNSLAEAFINAGVSDEFQNVLDCLNEEFDDVFPQPQA